ncbi:glucose-6-phosphate isomerase [Fuchsiella alkaliacetigena]|uniref:glucose-6-phosphate isomerase n=1 Tax=Fuchsiella alkaliacetigena TaxID=957042 RepID=UPI00200B195C|nr:glucose-6-phosphate isomerase [Fuchsiella alkaliacetigena]MCK8824779.1 glucose-6-phosphate isomerase [Fuchsiella alkaliacetigena]
MSELKYEDQEWQKEMKISLDVNNMFAEQVGEEHGLTVKDVESLEKRLLTAHEAIQEAKAAGEMGFMELPAGQQEVVEEIEELVAARRGEFENFVVLGIGGSALGAIALDTALNPPYYKLDSATRETPRLFVPDNVDPARLENLLATIDLEKTLFNVISKSGGTAETMSQFLIARDLVAQELGSEKVAEHFIATTSRDSGNLIKIAKEEGMPTFYIPENVGGRFSVLSPVGLLPAAFCGIDIKELLAGAEYMDQLCAKKEVWENPAYLNATLQYLADQQGKSISVMMPYVHALKDVADWYRQLWAESLGKEKDRNGQVVNVGPTPIKALGATDQHSQVQLYMAGPYDKVITLLAVEDYGAEMEIPKLYQDIEGVAYLGGNTLNELIQTERLATELALTKNQRLNCTITLPEVNEFTMGQLLYMFELQTAFAGELYNINAFNQPGVELGKAYTYGILGRSGFADKKEEFEARPEKDDGFIV